MRGIDDIAAGMKWSPKTRGQVTGYATSVPEFVCLVSAGLAGVWQAGLWNIASSNIINVILMLIAIGYYKQFRDLFNRRFIDEIGFAFLAIAVPIGLMRAGMDTQWYLIPALLGLFVIYRIVDHKTNRVDSGDVAHDTDAEGSLPLGMIFILTAIVSIIIAGIFLGDATANVVEQFGVHPAIAGWILWFRYQHPGNGDPSFRFMLLPKRRTLWTN